MVWLMKKTLLTVALSMSLSSAFLVGTASAATPTPNGVCSPAGSKTTIAAKNYVCAKVLSGKTVWVLGAGVGTLSKNPTAPKPAISGGPGRGFGEEGGAADVARRAALKKFSDCLVKNGGTAFGPGAGGFNRDEGSGGQPQGVRPPMSAAQQKAMTACAAFAPKFGRRGGDGNKKIK
jgi:hypothetical protein